MSVLSVIITSISLFFTLDFTEGACVYFSYLPMIVGGEKNKHFADCTGCCEVWAHLVPFWIWAVSCGHGLNGLSNTCCASLLSPTPPPLPRWRNIALNGLTYGLINQCPNWRGNRESQTQQAEEKIWQIYSWFLQSVKSLSISLCQGLDNPTYVPGITRGLPLFNALSWTFSPTWFSE